MSQAFSIGALGGTFDHFHAGHQHFLFFAARQARHLIIGITTEKMIHNKDFSLLIQPFQQRYQAVQQYLTRLNLAGTFELIPLADPYGPTLEDPKIECLIVTELTESGSEKLNALRQSRGFPALPVKVCSMFRDEAGMILNSSRIRAGAVNRDGVVYDRVFQADLALTSEQRQQFQRPWGKLVQTPRENDGDSMICVVGDRCAQHFYEQHLRANLFIFDGTEQRKLQHLPFFTQLLPQVKLKNPAGCIQRSVVQTLQTWLTEDDWPKYLQIEGEEDLLAVAAVLLLPLGALVYYGQPGLGMVELEVSEAVKDQMHNILKTEVSQSS